MATQFDDWAEQAVEQIRFRPDREAIQKELFDHMEDRKGDFLEELDDAEAELKVLQAMGDAKVVGKALNKVHSPWLGYAWLASKIIAIALVAVTGMALLFNLNDDLTRSRQWWNRNEKDYCGDLGGTETSVESGITFEEGSYIIRLDHGSIIRDYSWHRLTLGFEIYGYEPWLRYPGGMGNITVEDSLGNVYNKTVKEVEDTGTCLINLNMVQAWQLPWWRCHMVIEYLPWELEDGEYPQWQRITIENTDIDFTVWQNGEVRRNG